MIILKKAIYESIVNDIKAYNGLSAMCKTYLEEKYLDIPKNTIGSILSTQVQWQMRSNYRKSANKAKYYTEYKKCKESGEGPGILLRLSCQYHINPSLLARSLLFHLYSVNPGATKYPIPQLLKDSTLIEDQHLAYEVYLCMLYDNEYGHFGNTIKRCIGREYEQRLEYELQSLDISFFDENVLRNKGYDKTPDIKLILPIAINGFVINWIESKALFGDELTHKGYLKDQLLCYWNRFGPGLVIYWFGYVDTLERSTENNKMIILSDRFPCKESITVMNQNILE